MIFLSFFYEQFLDAVAVHNSVPVSAAISDLAISSWTGHSISVVHIYIVWEIF